MSSFNPFESTFSQPSQQHVTGLSISDALLYLDQIKSKTSAPVYNEFLGIMHQFKSQSISTLSAIKRVKTLFKGRNYPIDLNFLIRSHY